MGRVRGAGMGQRMLEEPGRGGTEKEGFGCSAGLHNQPGGLGGCSEGPALEKKVTKSALGGTSSFMVCFPLLHGQDESTECRKIPAPKPQVRDAGPFQQCPPSIPGCQCVPVPGEPQGAPRARGAPGMRGQAIPCSKRELQLPLPTFQTSSSPWLPSLGASQPRDTT